MGAVIEELSNKKLFTILSILGVIQIIFFILGATYSPEPSSSMDYLMTVCEDSTPDIKKWIHIRPSNCKIIPELHKYTSKSSSRRDIVFQAQMPHIRNGIQLEYSPWFQFLLGILDITIEYDPNIIMDEEILMEFEVRMGYKDKKDNDWKELYNINVTRKLRCSIEEERKIKGNTYNCDPVDLFELSSNPYPFYLLNIRIPVTDETCKLNPKAPNCALGLIDEIRFITIHQNGGFTYIWLLIKTLITPFIAYGNYWYFKRINNLNRPRYLVEDCILTLGVSTLLLDIPFEWITIFMKWPLLLLFNDIKQGIFYTILFSFWLIFAGEHLEESGYGNTLKNYWKNLTLIVISSIGFLFYDSIERGIQVVNPFFTIWSSDVGTKIATITLQCSCLSLILYVGFLIYKVILVWNNIRRKREAQLYQSNPLRRIKIENIIFRFKFLMIFTVLCAILTVTTYAFKQIGEIQYHDADPTDSLLTSWTSAFFIGTFGMWNIYVMLLLAMYAPSHKYFKEARILMSEINDCMDSLSGGNETASLTTLLKPSTD
uniref:Protein wntless homolog n=1 Tax=Parastrongyloides trichosuri TaxID=131310 RepID=A0A0N4ZG27_PARTI